ncbi:hypothetical protein BT96DRAFT_926518 [Gymnopus androsaceus JB14]|uniref:Uncharacterized protein n=1 Tax=Gymnopus androsaceus JB14 TaxID=1447944 RepID=A0A6A4GCZ6_9AGAR|nr:hypothetical protein BT96DRAFT_929895 [Gymnopus androsaceus JB14]KAE9389490.1 hypothetical protein BT96DRAFT_926518 [Gymnopus androsaceus JB14]
MPTWMPTAPNKWPYCITFLMFIGLVISLSAGPAFSRMIIELDILDFIRENYLDTFDIRRRSPSTSSHSKDTQLVAQILDGL